MKYLSIAALSLLGACSATSGLSPSQLALISQVQAGAIKACNFAPAVESVASLLGPYGAGADAIISAICAAIPPLPPTAARGAPSRVGEPAQIVVKGTVVKGVYTR